MPVFPDVQHARFVVMGPDVGTPDLGMYAPADRRAFWGQVAVLARDAKYSELNRGVDIHGRRMRGRIRPRPDGARGPVLIPHYADSRFRTQLRWVGTDDAAVLWWLAPWSDVVRAHAEGIRTRAGRIVRDVVGLTADSYHKVVDRARAWWAARVARERMGERAMTIVGPALPVPAAPPAWRVPPPRPVGSPFAPPKPVGVLSFGRRLEPWELARGWSDVMDRAASGRIDRAGIVRLANQVGRSQTVAAIRDVLVHLGVGMMPEDREGLVRLLALQAIERLRGSWAVVGAR